MQAREIYRDIYRGPYEPSLEEKIFLAAKRTCVAFAVVALVLGGLDIAGIRSIGNVGEALYSARAKIAALGDTVRIGVRDIALKPESASVLLGIPKSAPTPANSDNSLLVELAAVRDMDAVQIAMGPPLELAKRRPAPAMATPMPPVSRPESDTAAKSMPVRLASVQATMPPDTGPVPLPVSAPVAAIPIELVPLPRSAPGAPPPSPADLLGLKDKEYARAERCLANAIYFESRSEPLRGQMAVAQVVINRVFSGFYPNDVCSVVYQNANRRLACQFTFACDGKRKIINERGAWARANRIARQTLNGEIYVPEVAKSTHYHAAYVHPYCVREMRRMVRCGIDWFYRPYAWGSGAEYPAWGTAAMAQAGKKTETK